MFLSDEGPTLETCDFTFQIGRTPTILHFDMHPFNGSIQFTCHHT